MSQEQLRMFVQGSETRLADLRDSLVTLESDPDDRAAMDRIFRTAHTLKGNFDAMGYDDTSHLAHAIEDLLHELRDGEMAVTAEVIALLYPDRHRANGPDQ
jgi:two-component system chemotaxis sensor kinase CheA